MAIRATVYFCESCDKQHDTEKGADDCFYNDNKEFTELAQLLHNLLCSKSHSESGSCDWKLKPWTSDDHRTWLSRAELLLEFSRRELSINMLELNVLVDKLGQFKAAA